MTMKHVRISYINDLNGIKNFLISNIVKVDKATAISDCFKSNWNR